MQTAKKIRDTKHLVTGTKKCSHSANGSASKLSTQKKAAAVPWQIICWLALMLK